MDTVPAKTIVTKNRDTSWLGSGAMSDPYNPFEKEKLLTRHSLELIDAFGFGASMLTKSDMLLRDIDLYQSISEHSPVNCMMTITTADDELARESGGCL